MNVEEVMAKVVRLVEERARLPLTAAPAQLAAAWRAEARLWSELERTVPDRARPTLQVIALQYAAHYAQDQADFWAAQPSGSGWTDAGPGGP
ncbi:hypothetical protein [Pseudonocardia alni]|uniref:hypothetical protein n=1 Tax=Pseudonocardia alni TaxID=33907 RepID=UPI0033E54A2F